MTNPRSFSLSLLLLTLILAACAHASVIVRFQPPNLPPLRAGEQKCVALVIRGDGSRAKTVKVELEAPKGLIVAPKLRVVTIQPNRKAAAFFTIRAAGATSGQVGALVDSKACGSLAVGASYDLEALHWKTAFDKDNTGLTHGWTGCGLDDSAWADCMLPRQVGDIGITYLRTHVIVPDSWRGKAIHLRLRAVDDADICYLNGVEIGHGAGWDQPRDYRVDPKTVRFGGDNLLCIGVNNTSSGGGIVWSPNTFGIAPPEAAETPVARIAAPGKIGQPLPIRSMTVKNGVLLYEDGGEVCLWGANSYPQSWNQFDNMKRAGADMHKAICSDLDDMKQMGVELIRIHVFDREITDAKGGLIDNEHYELLDYIVSEASNRGIYLMFTPIGWWGTTDENPTSFSMATPKEYMFCDDAAIAAQANYVKNWLNHVNRYTHHAYKDEPAICLLEIMNEPAYVDYSNMLDAPWTYFAEDRGKMPPFKQRYANKWRAWCASKGIACDHAFWPLFRYDVMSHYLDTMYSAIRKTGARQPVACSIVETNHCGDLIEAIADSRCEAITFGGYIGDFHADSDRVNLLPQLGNTALDPLLNKKARVVYEFDALRTMDSYPYPAFARKFRNCGVQIASVFQYDSSVTAERNSDWDAHYLNLRCTPGKAVSYTIAGRVFHDLPRGAAFPVVGTTQYFGNCAVSFDRNISIYSADDAYLNSAPYAGWQPTKAPKRPRYITSIGDSPYATYAGTGIYSLAIDYANRVAKLTVNPDAAKVGDPWTADGVKSIVTLKYDAHTFKLTIPGITFAGVMQFDGDRGSEIKVSDNTFQAQPGVYYLTWKD